MTNGIGFGGTGTALIGNYPVFVGIVGVLVGAEDGSNFHFLAMAIIKEVTDNANETIEV